MPVKDLGLALIVMVVWGLNFPISKLGVADLPPILMIALRWTLVAALALPFCQMPTGRWRQLAWLSGVLGIAHFALNFTGVKLIDAATASVVAQVQVPIAALLGVVVERERPGIWRIAGMVVAFAGVVVIAGEPRILEQPAGVLLMVAGATCWAIGSLIAKRLTDLSPLSVNAWMALMSAPGLFLVSLVAETGHWAALSEPTWNGWFAVAYMAVPVTIVGYGIWYRLMRRHPVSTLMPFMLLVPLFGVASSAVLLGDQLSVRFLVGAAITLVGLAVLIVVRR
jgi:O-acetylserine/cysteine efflux transporter